MINNAKELYYCQSRLYSMECENKHDVMFKARCLQAIFKQIEMPIKETVSYFSEQEIISYQCPRCEWNVECYQDYCHKCGQKLMKGV